MSTESCKDCRFSEKSNLGLELLLCRRRAPVLLEKPSYLSIKPNPFLIWPSVESDWWCGEHKPLPVKDVVRPNATSLTELMERETRAAIERVQAEDRLTKMPEEE